MKYPFLAGTYFVTLFLCAQQHQHIGAQPLNYPNIDGYITLKTDLHQHTVFSDGHVWPSIRIMEALREDLDVISLTEHLEKQPHAQDIPHPDRNRAYEIAIEEAKDHQLLIVHGSEITRSAPTGHSNAIFLEDSNKLVAQDSLTPFNEAIKQGAFIFWNHPAWHEQSPSGQPILSEFQKELIDTKKLHGIEVINTTDYSEDALALALEHKLTIMGTSDIHGLIDWDYTEKGHHRPITLVFAKERSQEALKQALFDGRTVAVYKQLLVGREEHLIPLLKACVQVKKAEYISKTQVLQVELENISSSALLFENQMPYTFYGESPVFEIPSGGTYTLQINTVEKKENIQLRLKALGAFIAPRVQPVVEWNVTVE